MSDTREKIAPILTETYGRGAMVYALAVHLAERIDGYKPAPYPFTDDRERMIARVCWDWMPGGTTAEATASKIEMALGG